MSRQDYRTPQWLFRLLSDDFGPFQTDAFADADNALCAYHCDGIDQDGFFAANWRGTTFANPPFNRSDDAMRCAYTYAMQLASTSVVLLQAGISTKWFHTYAIYGRVLIPDMRINYSLPGVKLSSFNRDSIIVCFGPTHMGAGIKPYPIRARRKQYEQIAA